jgi:hypothetical protein
VLVPVAPTSSLSAARRPSNGAKRNELVLGLDGDVIVLRMYLQIWLLRCVDADTAQNCWLRMMP